MSKEEHADKASQATPQGPHEKEGLFRNSPAMDRGLEFIVAIEGKEQDIEAQKDILDPVVDEKEKFIHWQPPRVLTTSSLLMAKMSSGLV